MFCLVMEIVKIHNRAHNRPPPVPKSGRGRKPVKTTRDPEGPEGGTGPEYVAHVFGFLGSTITCRLYRLTH